MEPYSEITLEGIKFDLWGDFEDNEESIHKKKMIPSDYSSEMINKIGDFERRYPLSKDLLQRMLDLGLEVERESTPAALDLIRFINNRVMKSIQNWLSISKWLVVKTVLTSIYGNVGTSGSVTPRWKAKDVDEDGKCLKIRSRCVKVFGYILQELKKINLKKHEVKQVQQSCLGEDCWEIYILA
ncbi:hypothetical protein Tco_0071441 [Tanacetum coccineum]